jgi:hypothetical protein
MAIRVTSMPPASRGSDRAHERLGLRRRRICSIHPGAVTPTKGLCFPWAFCAPPGGQLGRTDSSPDFETVGRYPANVGGPLLQWWRRTRGRTKDGKFYGGRQTRHKAGGEMGYPNVAGIRCRC